MTDKEGDISLFRLLDANLNRLREGIRVCEDIQRYIKNSKPLSQKLKAIRHKIRVDGYYELLKARDIVGDVLKETTLSESNRDDLNSIMIANIKRSQESARVLEEILKIVDSKNAQKFKLIRYELYDIEKELFNPSPNKKNFKL